MSAPPDLKTSQTSSSSSSSPPLSLSLSPAPPDSTPSTAMSSRDVAPGSPHSDPQRPANARSATAPDPSQILLKKTAREGDDTNGRRPYFLPVRPASRHRNQSPNSLGLSLHQPTGSPATTRAHSLPSPDIARLPLDIVPALASTSGRSTKPVDELTSSVYPSRASNGVESAIGAIQEDRALDFSPRSRNNVDTLSSPSVHHPFRPAVAGRRRPVSPLHSFVAPSASTTATTSFTTSLTSTDAPSNASGANSPALGPAVQRYTNETYPPPLLQLHHQPSLGSTSSLTSFPSVSMSSTPSSIRSRSRSPSISSLDTIEDAPEMESEAEAIERLRLAAEHESRGDGEGGDGDTDAGDERRRSSLDVPRGFGFGRGRSERKRWSICGGERRGDLDLETIWED